MKKISALIFLFTALTMAQIAPQKSLIELKNEIKNSTSPKSDVVLLTGSETQGKKNAALAILYSLILPGMGELYVGNYNTGKYFTIAEAALWGTYIGIDAYGNWQKNNYKEYAQTNGGVNPAGKDDDYYANIGSYKDIDQYNDDRSFNRDFGAMYETSTHYFKWNTTEERKTYRNMWVSSENAFNNIRFVVGGLIVNRIVSAVNAWRATVSYNKKLSQTSSTDFYIGIGDGVTSAFDGLNLQMRTSF